MFAKLLCVLLAVGVVAANPVTELLGVDPNTLFCDTLGEIFLLLPHFTHCTKYFICVHGKEVEQDCPSDLYFDFEKQTCNWPRATKCWLRGEDIEGSGDDSDEAPVHKSAAPAFQPKVDCSNSETASKQVPYQGDCQRFWRCSHGALESAYCSDGLFFNTHKQMCDHEANVNCASQAEDELKGEFIVYK